MRINVPSSLNLHTIKMLIKKLMSHIWKIFSLFDPVLFIFIVNIYHVIQFPEYSTCLMMGEGSPEMLPNINICDPSHDKYFTITNV